MRRCNAEAAYLCELLKCRHPLFQAPMAGGPSTPALAAAVASVGAVGCLASPYLSAGTFHQHLREAKLTARKKKSSAESTTCLVANYFVPHHDVLNLNWEHPANRLWLNAAREATEEWAARASFLISVSTSAQYTDRTQGHEAAVRFMKSADVSLHRQTAAAQGVPEAVDPQKLNPAASFQLPTAEHLITTQRRAVSEYERAIVAAIEEGVNGCSFVFGAPDPAIVKELKSKKIAVMGTATSVEEAMELREAGFDVVIAQGVEAGGHRGTFRAPICATREGIFNEAVAALDPVFRNPGHDQNALGTNALVRQIVDAFATASSTAINPVVRARKIPVIAAGGIAEADGIVTAFLHGAAGVQLGTAFMLTVEAGTSDVQLRAMREWSTRPTVFTRAFSGRWARGIENATILRFAEPASRPTSGNAVDDAVADAMKSARQEAEGSKVPDCASPSDVLPFPLQNELFGSVKRRSVAMAESAAAKNSPLAVQGRLAAAEFLNLWAGANMQLALRYDRQSASQVAASLIAQADDMLELTVKS